MLREISLAVPQSWYHNSSSLLNGIYGQSNARIHSVPIWFYSLHIIFQPLSKRPRLTWNKLGEAIRRIFNDTRFMLHPLHQVIVALIHNSAHRFRTMNSGWQPYSRLRKPLNKAPHSDHVSCFRAIRSALIFESPCEQIVISHSIHKPNTIL